MRTFWIALATFCIFASGLWVGERLTMSAVMAVEDERWEKRERQYEQILRTVIDLAICESALRPNAVGDRGQSRGILQYKRPTFAEFQREAGRPELQWLDPADQIILTKWAVQNGKEKHWACWDKIAN